MHVSLSDLIDKVLTPVYDAVKDMHYSLQLALILTVVIVTQGPKLLALRTRWLDYRLNRNRLQFEKERLETLKLHYEIEAIKKTNNLPTDTYETDLFQEEKKSTFSIKYPHFPRLWFKLESHIQQKKMWSWLNKKPLLANILVYVNYLFITLGFYLFAFSTISMLVVSFTVDSFIRDLGLGPTVTINLVYLVLTGFFFYWKKVFSHWHKELDEKQTKDSI